MIVTIFAYKDDELLLECADVIQPSDAKTIAEGLMSRLGATRVFFIDNAAEQDDPNRCLFDTNHNRLLN